jgi:hypothetical protein
MATVWARINGWAGGYDLDRVEVGGITTALAIRSRVDGPAFRLVANAGRSFQGSKVIGMGFVLSRDEALEMLRTDARNADVVRPYLVGEDLNQRPDGSPSRWVIDFGTWPAERAQTYGQPFDRVERLVRSERARKSYSEATREKWWLFERPRVELYRAIAPLDRCIAITLVSKTVQPMIVPTGVVYAHKLGVFAYDDYGHFGLLSSGVHREWAIEHGSTMRVDPNYSTTDCFETFVQPELTDAIGELGGALHEHRSALMLDRQEGLTKTYNRVHDPDEDADDIVRLRQIHTQLDYAVRDAYGWSDLDLGHDFHETKFGVRYTFAPQPRQEVLDRLLELNHERYAEEVRQGLHKKAKTRAKQAPGVMAMNFDGH